MSKILLLALAIAAAPESQDVLLPSDWSLARPAPAKVRPARPAQAAGMAKARHSAGAKPRLRAGATMTNRNVRGGKKAKVGVAVPF